MYARPSAIPTRDSRVRHGFRPWVVLAALLTAWSPSTRAQNTPPPLPEAVTAELPGVRMAYRDTGGPGTPVVFLHAATGSSLSWIHQAHAFVAAGHRVIAYDRRGFAGSVPTSGADVGTAVDDLHALVDHLRLARFSLVATAAGGFVALDYAVSHPERLTRLVVANSMGLIQDEAFLEVGRHIRPASFESLPIEFKELSPSYRAANPDGVTRWLEIARTNRASGAPPVSQPPKNRMTAALLRTIRTPTLLVSGEADFYMPPTLMRMMAAEIRGARTGIVPESGHAAFWENPEAFNRLVLAFLAGG